MTKTPTSDHDIRKPFADAVAVASATGKSRHGIEIDERSLVRHTCRNASHTLIGAALDIRWPTTTVGECNGLGPISKT